MHYGPYAVLAIVVTAGFLYGWQASAHEVPPSGDLGTLFLTKEQIDTDSDLICGTMPYYNLSTEPPAQDKAFAARSLLAIGCPTSFVYTAAADTTLTDSTMNLTIGCSVGAQFGSPAPLDTVAVDVYVNETQVATADARASSLLCTGSSKIKLFFEFTIEETPIAAGEKLRLDVVLFAANTERSILANYYYFVGGEDGGHFHPNAPDAPGPSPTGTPGTSGTSGTTSTSATTGTTGTTGTGGTTSPTGTGGTTATTGTSTSSPTQTGTQSPTPTTTGPHCNVPTSTPPASSTHTMGPTSTAATTSPASTTGTGGSSTPSATTGTSPTATTSPASTTGTSATTSAPPTTSGSATTSATPTPSPTGTATPPPPTTTGACPSPTRSSGAPTGSPPTDSPTGEPTGSPTSPTMSDCICQPTATTTRTVAGAGAPGLGMVPILVILGGLAAALMGLRRHRQ